MSTIITKNSSTASAAPAVGDLTKGELAVNVTDKKLYTKDNSAAIVKIVGSLGNQEANAVAITGGSIAGITDLAVADGGTGASTAADARTNLGVTATGADTAYAFRSNNLSDLASASTARTNLGLGSIATQAASSVTITGGSVTGITDITVADGGTGASTASGARINLGAAASGANSDITSLTGLTTALSVAQGGTGVTTSTGTGNVVLSTSPTLVTPVLGTPTSATLTNATGLPISSGVSGLGTGVATALAVNVGSAGAAVVNGGALGTPSSGTATNLTGLPLSTGVTGTLPVANGGTGVTTSTGSGNNVLSTSPTLVTPILGTPTSATLTNATGLPLSTGVTGTLPVANGGTGTTTPSLVAGTNVTVTGTWPNQTIAASGGGGGGTPGGSTTQVQYNNAGAFGGITGATTNGTALTLVAPVLGTPASATLTNATGLPLSTGVTGTLPIANGGTGLTTTPANGALDIGNGTGFTRTTLTAGSNVTITNASGSITIAASGGGASAATPTVEGTVFGKMTASGGTPFLTALGYNAGLNNTGVSNSAVGWEALKANTSGTLNTALGYQAGASNVSANRLTAVGYQAGLNSTAASNSFFGAYAGNQISTGIANTGIGDNALGNAANTGSYNTALGQGALANISNSSNSVGVGYLAGNLITTGGKNTIIGGYNGNQDGLDIRTASSYAIIADGDGNRQITTKEGQTLALDSAVPNSGTGITFPATQSASSDANTLDDYEEGTWSPSIESAGGSLTAVNNGTGYYTKVGRVVTIMCKPVITTNGTGSSYLRITGLPFPVSSNHPYFAGASRESGAVGDTFSINYFGATTLMIRRYDSAYMGANGAEFPISISYFV